MKKFELILHLTSFKTSKCFMFVYCFIL